MNKKPRQLPPRPGVAALLSKYFFSGILVVIPLAVSGWIIGGVLGTLWTIQEILPPSLHPENFFPDPMMALLVRAAFTVSVALMLAIGVSFLGWMSSQYLGQKVLELIGSMIQRIPVLRTIYSSLDQLLKTMAAGGGQQFSRVVYIEYPRKGIWTLAFVTGPARTKVLPENHLNVYVPTTPNPTSGFHLIVPESEVRESNLRVEEAFKTILSLGIAK